MARLSFSRVPSRPPYVAREDADRALLTAGERLSIVLLLGEGQGRGVTRTLKHFAEKTDRHYFLGGKPRYPMILDLFGNSCLPAVEVLVLLRNLLVIQANRLGGTPSTGIYLFPFDALYKIWLHQFDLDAEIATPLVRTTRGRLGRRAAKVAVTLASMGTVELAGDVGEIARLGRELAWGGKATIDISRDQLVEGAFEWGADAVEALFHKRIAPKLSRRLRAKIGSRRLTSEDLAQVMQELLLDAMLSIQDDLRDRGRFIFLADAIDEAADDDRDTIIMRAAVSGFFTGCVRSTGSGIMAGRQPAELWYEEVKDHEPERLILSDLDLEKVRSTLEEAGLKASAVDQILRQAGAPDPIYAARLSEAFRRAASDKSSQGGAV